MKKLIFLFIPVFIIACHTPKENLYKSIGNTNNLDVQEFTVYPDIENNFTTQNGIKIKIASNTFDSKTPVHIQFKEALNMYDITKAGLLTIDKDGNALSSAGMFYIDTKEKIKFQKPIKISLPTNNLNTGMKLYKGETEDERIVWEDPQDIEIKPFLPQKIDGEKLYKNNCTSCHKIDQDMTGPPLAFATTRQDMDWLISYTRDWQSVIDPYACKMNLFDSSTMDKFPNLSDSDIIAIFKYIDAEALKMGLVNNSTKYQKIDCNEFFKVRDSLELLYNYNQKDNGKMIKTNVINLDTGKIPKINIITPPQYYADYYEINITTPGWYNLDIMLNATDAVKSELKVHLSTSNTDRLQVYLVIPSHKIFTPGGFVKKMDEFSFSGKDYSVALPQNVPAYVFVMGETKGKFFFDFKEFVTSKKEKIILQPKEYTPEAIKLEIAKMSLPDINFDILESKNKNKMEEIDDFLKKYSDCDCFDYGHLAWISSKGDTFNHEPSCDCYNNKQNMDSTSYK